MLLATLDDFSPTAVEERESGVRIFFATTEARDAAMAMIATLNRPRHEELNDMWRRPSSVRVEIKDVSDEDWAQRSQQNLAPITVGRITIVSDSQSEIPNPRSAISSPRSLIPSPHAIQLVIPPSMAFGTGHHATTRLCLAGLQTLDLVDAFVVDVGTGSGVLAMAASALGARRAIGIDHDPDAIAAARENLTRNPQIRGVEFLEADLPNVIYTGADLLTANLTCALLVATATALTHAIRTRGHLIVSGFLSGESDAVARAFGKNVKKLWQSEEDGWIGAALMKK